MLREFRGDGHLAALAVGGFVWPEPHLLKGDLVDPRQQDYRGWDDESWQRAAQRVGGRDSAEVEHVTDRLAAPACEPLDGDELRRLADTLDPLARLAAREIPYPNAMGLSPLQVRRTDKESS